MAELEQIYKKAGGVYTALSKEIQKVIVGQDDVIEHIVISILTGTHALLEGYPGLGKTMLIRTISDALDMDFSRIQCTPDLMPSDITGTYVIEEKEGKKIFNFHKGPVFSNILLADEINRATPKTQSALLEAMQEKQVTVGDHTYLLEPPFYVLATQNPIEMEGTYPLPEAQLDRFLLKILVHYPDEISEGIIVDKFTGSTEPIVRKILSKDQVMTLQKLTRQMPISNELKTYVVKLVSATRPNETNKVAASYLDYGASPRASIGIVLAAKARALINSRDYVSKEDIMDVAIPVMRHRLILNFESEREGITTDQVIERIVKTVK